MMEDKNNPYVQIHNEVLKERKPDEAQFLKDWDAKYGRRTFDFKEERDQADFYEAMQEMTRQIVGTAQNATFVSVTSVDGLTRFEVGMTPTPADVSE